MHPAPIVELVPCRSEQSKPFGKDTCVLAMTGAWNKTQTLVPELQYKDRMVPKPVAAPPTRELGEPPSQKAKAGAKVQQKKMPRPAQQATGTETVERPTRGSTGLAIMSPQSFVDTWSSTAMPASPDELTVVVWPPTHDEVTNIPHETVIFPARVVQQGSSVTLLKGVAYHLGAKRINLKHEETNEFKTRRAVSLMVELERSLLDSTTWAQLVNKPVEHVQLTLGKQIPLLSSWGTRYWDSQDKIASPKDCQRVATNVRISPEHLQTVLKISGTNIWISPRSGQTVFQNYRPIWVRGNLTEVRRQHDVLEHAAGIIKGKRGFAVRVTTEKLEEAKQCLYPGQIVQPSLDPTEQVSCTKFPPRP